MHRSFPRRPALVAVAAVTAMGGIALVVGSGAGPASAAPSLSVQEIWSQNFNDGGGETIGSSPAVAQLAGGPAAVFGDTAGNIYAVHLADGSEVPGWPARVPDGAPVDGPVSVNGSEIFVPAGDWANPQSGGYLALNGNGSEAWYNHTTLLPAGSANNKNEGVIAGLTVGDYNGTQGVVAGSLGQLADGFAVGGGQLAGFPWFQGDTNSSTAALSDLYGSGQDLVFGGASTAGLAYGVQYPNGGHVRVLDATGHQICNYFTQQPVYSSPAVGHFLSGGGVGIAATTESGYSGQGQVDQVMGFNPSCQLQWSTAVPGTPRGGPALVDALGDNGLQVAVTSYTSNNAGYTTLLNGANGAVLWQTPSLGAGFAGPVSVDLGGGYQDLVVAGSGGVQILDGQNGQVLWQQASNGVVPDMQNAALVTDDPNGTVGITLAGYWGSPLHTVVSHFEIAGSNGSLVSETGGWPEYHHDPQLTGDAGGQPTNVACSAPSGPAGYVMADTRGDVFNFGNLPFCGSAGNLPLAKPVVDAVETPDGGGYYLVASDGGVFTFGDARYYGSTGGEHLDAPIVGMAVDPAGTGYWLVASDGGIFSFGSAQFYGSKGGQHLNKPVVGMAADPAGPGYWLVASDGGIFTFGAAGFHGSTGAERLNKPVVGMAAAPNGQGYWLVASDGGIFTFNVPFYGSAGNLRLAAPIVGMAPAPGNAGYWLLGADGGVFTYGSIPYYGSRGGLANEYPMVSFGGV